MAWLKVFDNIYINLQHIIRIDFTEFNQHVKLVFYTQQGAIISKRLPITKQQADNLIFFLVTTNDMKDVYDIEELAESLKNYEKNAKEAQVRE